ncbi:MAG: hypothetical protein J0H96_05660 [Microbacterium ginsengisoli]|nr:hypothetical protein [Microbacterium ginsengisoli]
MNEGPTTVGSIVGKLRMDRDEWVAQLAATKKDIHDIESANPDIRVGATTGEAVAKLAAVDQQTQRLSKTTDGVTAAEARLTAAMKAADAAFARADLAQTRLNEVRDRGVTTGSRLMSAEIALTEALRRLDAANEKATASEAALAAAQQAAAAAALEEAAAQDDVERSTVKANEANRTNVTRVGAIATAVALLVPLLAPVGAVAIGIAGALLGMGSAGVLALFGIRKEMQDGTAVGTMYRAGLTELLGMFDTLSRTAAVNMLGSFRSVVAQLHADMPMLNTQVAQFSGILGRTGAAAVGGTIAALRVLNPLFATAGLYVQSLAEGFQRWATGSGIEKFGGYALSMLPTVTDVLGRLASMVMHILEALAPLGTIGMAVLSGISTVINAIPVEILSQLIVSLTWGAIAFKTWGFVAPMLASIATTMGAVGTATTIATGPIGWVVAGLSALAGVLAVVIANNNGATIAMQNYTAAVQADNGVIGENVRQTAIKQLQDAKAYENAKLLGVSTTTVTQAVLGNADAQAKLNKLLGDGTKNGKESLDFLSKVADRTGMSLTDVTYAALDLRAAVDSNRDGISAEIQANKELQDALGGTTAATYDQKWADEAASAALGLTGTQLTNLKNQASSAKDSVTGLADAIRGFGSDTLDTRDAQRQLEQAVDTVTTTLESQKAAYKTAHGSLKGFKATLDISTQSGRDNQAAIDAIAKSTIAYAASIEKQTGDQAAASKAIAEGRQHLIDQLAQFGVTGQAAQDYATNLGLVPDNVSTVARLFTDDAVGRLAYLKGVLDSLPVTKNIRVNLTMPNGNVVSDQQLADQFGIGAGKANGGTIGGFALGGTPRRVGDAVRGLAAGGGGSVVGRGTAGSDSAGLYRLANGEEVISNIFGQADRNRALLKQINAGLTPSMQTLQAAPPSTRASETHVHINVTGVNQEDPRVLGMIIGGRVTRALAAVPK